MSYSKFKFADLKAQFGLQQIRTDIFPPTVKPLAPTAWLTETLAKGARLPITTEKMRSEVFVYPILVETLERNNDFIQLFSGENLMANKKAKLTGEIDFILAKGSGVTELQAPIISVVEAKKSDIQAAIPQCAAQMIGVRTFNDLHGCTLPIIYGAVTTGEDWLFLRLKDMELETDTQTFYLSDLPSLLGVLQYIVDSYR